MPDRSHRSNSGGSRPTTRVQVPKAGGPTDPVPAPPAPSTELAAGERLGIPERRSRPPVPVRSIVTAIGLVLATVATIWLLDKVSRIITWCVVAAFFAVVLTPPVNFLQKRLRFRRGFAALVVFLLGVGMLAALLTAFITPIVRGAPEWADSAKEYVSEAQSGQGVVGRIVKKYDLEKKVNDWVDKNNVKVNEWSRKQAGKVTGILGSVFNGIAAVLTIGVLTIFMLLEGPEILLNSVRILSPPNQERALKVGRDCAKAVTGYVAGNLAISVIAGLFTWSFLLIIGVPFAGVLGLWVAFADLIPLVGATLGAIPAILVAFLHSVPAGIAALIFYVVYQQFENHVLQTTIMARTVAIKPLVVLLSVLLGVELFGLLGALLAIPFAGIVKVIGTDIVAHRRPDLLTGPSGRERKLRRPRSRA